MRCHQQHSTLRVFHACVLIACVFAAASIAHARVWRVDIDAAPGGNGRSWATAFQNLHDGLAACRPGDEIWVAEGVYCPAGPGGARSLSFVIPDGAQIYGGFSGSEQRRFQRNWRLHRTVLSGDLNRDDDPADPDTRAENSHHVLVVSGNLQDAIIDGVIIRDGNANGEDEHADGGGILLEYGALELVQVELTRNSASGHGGGIMARASSLGMKGGRIHECSANEGGGMAVVGSFADVNDVQFISNSSVVHGGAVHSSGASDLSITLSRFAANTAESGASGIRVTDGGIRLAQVEAENGSSGQGGFLRVERGSLEIDACRFVGHTSVESASAVYLYQGTSAVVRDSLFVDNEMSGLRVLTAGSTVISNCRFRNNHAIGDGGGIDLRSTYARVDDCEFVGNRLDNGSGGGALVDAGTYEFARCTFQANRSDEHGGAILVGSATVTIDRSVFLDNLSRQGGGALHVDSGVLPRIANCVFRGNISSRRGSVAWIEDGATATFANCTLVGNASAQGGTLVAVSGQYRNATIYATNCIVRNGGTEGVAEDRSSVNFEYCNVERVEPLGKNIDTDPRFVPGTIEPDAGSPCIDQGSTLRLPSGMEAVDLQGRPRQHDDLWMSNRADESTTPIDMGAVEFQGQSGPLAEIAASPEQPIAGQPVTIIYSSGNAGEPAWLFMSRDGVGEFDLPRLGLWINLTQPQAVGGVKTVSADGRAERRFEVPGGAGGRRFHVQVAQEGVKSDTLQLDIAAR